MLPATERLRGYIIIAASVNDNCAVRRIGSAQRVCSPRLACYTLAHKSQNPHASCSLGNIVRQSSFTRESRDQSKEKGKGRAGREEGDHSSAHHWAWQSSQFAADVSHQLPASAYEPQVGHQSPSNSVSAADHQISTAPCTLRETQRKANCLSFERLRKHYYD